MLTYKGKNAEKLLISSPVDADFEMMTLACGINLIKGLVKSRFKTPMKKDNEMLKDPNLPERTRLAVTHRLNQKEILQSNIHIYEVLMRIMARVKEGKGLKEAYMKPIDGLEEKGSEMMLNRLITRNYLREYAQNQINIV